MDEQIEQPRTPQQIAADGGQKGPKVPLLPKEITGDDVLKQWEKKHGSTDIPAYKRHGTKRKTGREAFSDQ